MTSWQGDDSPTETPVGAFAVRA